MFGGEGVRARIQGVVGVEGGKQVTMLPANKNNNPTPPAGQKREPLGGAF